MALFPTRIDYGSVRLEFDGGAIFERETAANINWHTQLSSGKMSLAAILTVDAINGTTLHFNGYVQFSYEVSEKPTLEFLLPLMLLSPSKLNEILNPMLAELTNLSADLIPAIDPEWAELVLRSQLEKIP